MIDKAAIIHLQNHYDAMWNRAFSDVASGNIECDDHLRVGRDRRRGLSLIARPSQALRARFEGLLDGLVRAEPQQYPYPGTDMHVTILPLFTAVENPVEQLARLSDCVDSVRAALDGIEAFDIKFDGITVSRSAVLARGFPCSQTLETLRERLRMLLHDAGLDAMLDQRYRLVTAHTTLFRFVLPLQNPPHFAAQLRTLRDAPLGCMRVDELELVIADWYMSSDSLNRIASLTLKTPA